MPDASGEVFHSHDMGNCSLQSISEHRLLRAPRRIRSIIDEPPRRHTRPSAWTSYGERCLLGAFLLWRILPS